MAETEIRYSKGRMPNRCPSCEELLAVGLLFCQDQDCQTQIRGGFELSVFDKLSTEDQKLVYDFVLLSGSLKDLARQYDLSYPTIRNMLDELIDKLKKNQMADEN